MIFEENLTCRALLVTTKRPRFKLVLGIIVIINYSNRLLTVFIKSNGMEKMEIRQRVHLAAKRG